MSDTPRTDRVTRNYADSSVEWEEELVPVDACRTIERELNAANAKIKRLEEAGDALKASHYFGGWADAVNKWVKIREEQP